MNGMAIPREPSSLFFFFFLIVGEVETTTIKLGRPLRENCCPIKLCFFYAIFTAVKNYCKNFWSTTCIQNRRHNAISRLLGTSLVIFFLYSPKLSLSKLRSCAIIPPWWFSLISQAFFAILGSFLFFLWVHSFGVKIFKVW